MSDLRETFSDVSALIPRYSWEIMDEEQRDDLMANVVLPRYMKTTADDVQLGPTAWAEIVGATASAIESRVRRLKASQKSDTDESARAGLTPSQKSAQRHAKTVLRDADDETLSTVIASLPPARIEALAQAAHEVQIKNIRKTAGDTEPALTGDDYVTARERITDARASSTIEMQEFFTAFSRLRVRGIENVIANATAQERRQWADRLIEVSEYALLGHDLCKTQKLEAVR